MAQYKTIPVDQETYDKLKELCEARKLKQGAQVSLLVNVEWEKLKLVKFVPVDVPARKNEKRVRAEKPIIS